MVRLEYTYIIYALFVIPLFIAIYLIARVSRRRNLDKFGDKTLIYMLFPDASPRKQWIKFSILMLAVFVLILGTSNPQIGTKMEKVERKGVDVMILLDVSRSMKCEDVKPNRLERAKQYVSRLIDKMMNDRIGIVVFAGDSYLQLPMTTDYSAAKLFLGAIDCDMIPTQGTAIGQAIDMGLKSFREEDQKYKTMIIITDGENHEDDAFGSAKSAAGSGVIIHTIGMGTTDGGPIPVFNNNGNRVGYLTDNEGNTVVTKADRALLQQIASAGNGKFIHAGGSDPDLSALLDEISGMEKKKYESKMFTEYEDRFQIFIALALILMTAELFFSDKKNKMLTGWKLFEEKK